MKEVAKLSTVLVLLNLVTTRANYTESGITDSDITVSTGVDGSKMTFNYFAYGSNLLQERLHLHNPTATRKCPAQLKNYRLDFGYHSKRWPGSVATIVPDEGASVWGSLWEIDSSQQENLDRQESVHEGIYEAINVTVLDDSGNSVTCRTYQLSNLPEKASVLPKERFPSKVYLDVMIKGARESNLPEYYINTMLQIPHNGYDGPVYL